MRLCSQSIGLLEHLVRCGSERVIDECRDRLYTIRSLQDFRAVDGAFDWHLTHAVCACAPRGGCGAACRSCALRSRPNSVFIALHRR